MKPGDVGTKVGPEEVGPEVPATPPETAGMLLQGKRQNSASASSQKRLLSGGAAFCAGVSAANSAVPGAAVEATALARLAVGASDED